MAPLLAGIAQMIHGARLLLKTVEKTCRQAALGSDRDLNEYIGDLLDRPSRIVAHEEAGTINPLYSNAFMLTKFYSIVIIGLFKYFDNIFIGFNQLRQFPRITTIL